jgi:hypothetical protein
MDDDFRLNRTYFETQPSHETDHGRGDYVTNLRHTNVVKNFFSILSRGITDNYHYMN